ncbi:YdcF family protein [Albimonas sp. CAU 1670]|uniref:YdcF family protein n=1 Tax=Albimonas sp. CAU 1670 TaxID=3032599 RepID=UPI0023DCE385|nr:YdcF family protein [Albimonas sp. CAU 1670]MDF2233250.1 YdcF family protein [Albimonas sp. CAU 1670]
MTEALVVLGAALRPDGRPSPALTRRIETAARLFAAGRAPWALVSGGPARGGVSEAEAMRRALVERGVPEAAILVEDRARDTLENARFAIPILRAAGVRRAVLVTDRVHMPRALAVFRLLGMPAAGAPCAAPTGRRGAVYRVHEAAALPLHAARAAAIRLRRGRH